MEEGCQGKTKRKEAEKKRKRRKTEREVRYEIVQKVVADIEKTCKGADRCQANRTKNSWAKCQAKLGLLAY